MQQILMDLVASQQQPAIIGLCAAQGAGKTTLARALVTEMEGRGLSAAALSIDDLYLTKAERAQLAQNIHPLLATRGVPGTHDIGLGCQILEDVKKRRPVLLPRFDKATDDRCASALWTAVEKPLDLLIFEGWCVGAEPQNAADLERPLNDLEALEDPDARWRHYVQKQLLEVYPALFRSIDLLVFMQAPSWDIVFKWRAQQEQELRKTSLGGAAIMNATQLKRFLQHYERLTRHILKSMPEYADVIIPLDDNRVWKRIITRQECGRNSG